MIAIVFVVVGTIHLLLGRDRLLGQEGVQTTFQGVLSDILLLVVGIELTTLLVRRTPKAWSR